MTDIIVKNETITANPICASNVTGLEAFRNHPVAGASPEHIDSTCHLKPTQLQPHNTPLHKPSSKARMGR
jgi:hypothetical protein